MLWHRNTNVSGERTASIFRVEVLYWRWRQSSLPKRSHHSNRPRSVVIQKIAIWIINIRFDKCHSYHLPKTFKIRIYRTTVLPQAFYECGTWSHHWGMNINSKYFKENIWPGYHLGLRRMRQAGYFGSQRSAVIVRSVKSTELVM